MVPIAIYRAVISPLKPPTCRFHPTCSAYALQALRAHGVLRGCWLALRRLLRCHPFTEPGEDPVPGTGQSGPGQPSSGQASTARGQRGGTQR